MGTWGIEPFENDTACDWCSALESVDDFSFIKETLEKVDPDGGEYLEAAYAEEVVAAADVIAKLGGDVTYKDRHPGIVDEWVLNHPFDIPCNVVEKATKAIDRILRDPSELLDMWKESDELQEWVEMVEELRGSLFRVLGK